MVLPVCLLLLTLSGQALAAGGSTRLTIRLDQNVVDAIARWRGETVGHPAIHQFVDADRMLQHLLPAARAGLVKTHHPQSTERILQRLRQDALIVFDGRAEHAGSSGGRCVSESSSGGLHTVHSI